MSVLRLHGGSAAWVASAPIFNSVPLTLGSGFSGLAGASKATLRGRLALDPSDLEHGSMLPSGERNRWQTSLGLLLSRSGRW
ncbi:hypothetical protein BHS06_28915 [Myxococcus xanthus]|uniref:hypothetical protein n=1 Tax=Myxococcus xanthus TaxID=34 RepID=UPI001162823A|nr:hypothetical protein [Myxococcus xanthus]QDE92679.1 hypothetical protein BHS06_28915 [Myxococcus xanthus]